MLCETVVRFVRTLGARGSYVVGTIDEARGVGCAPAEGVYGSPTGGYSRLSRPPPLTPPASTNSSTPGTAAGCTRWMLTEPVLPRAGVRVTSVDSFSTGTFGLLDLGGARPA